MDVRNCPSCGKIFVYVRRNLCPECVKEDEANFDRVRDYIYDHPDASLDEVSKATEISTKKILDYLKEGRLMLKNTASGLLKCEVCSEPILTGRLCESCGKEFKKGLKGSFRGRTSNSGPGKARLHLSKLSRDRKR